MTDTRWGMVVDLNRCVGCQTCTIACKHANDTPPGVQWRSVLDVERGSYPDVGRLFLVTGCQHCAEPPCVPVCPTGATRQRADGLVMMDYRTCIGCGYCAVACPYQARTIVHDQTWYYGGAPTVQERQTAHDERIGVANKCTFCVERIDEAADLGLTPGIDLEYTPACAASCIAQAIHFGDFADRASNVSRLAAENANFQMHAELGTDPQIRYLYEVSGSTPGQAAEAGDLDDAALSDPGNPLVGRRQIFWDARAAMNFTLGGMASGLIVAAFLAWLAGILADAPALLAAYAVGAVFMAIGLFFVFLEIGRKLRFLYVLLRPQSSWMTRETYAVALIYPALLLDMAMPHAMLHGLVAAAAAAFLYCQAKILHDGKGIPAWRAPLIPAMLVATGLLEGTGLLAAFLAVTGFGAGHDFADDPRFAQIPRGRCFVGPGDLPAPDSRQLAQKRAVVKRFGVEFHDSLVRSFGSIFLALLEKNQHPPCLPLAVLRIGLDRGGVVPVSRVELAGLSMQGGTSAVETAILGPVGLHQREGFGKVVDCSPWVTEPFVKLRPLLIAKMLRLQAITLERSSRASLGCLGK